MDDEIMKRVRSLLMPFNLRLYDYDQISTELLHSMEKGLCRSTRKDSSLKMYPSFVTKLPNKTGMLKMIKFWYSECGKYLALDLGGTNYRVLLVTLFGKEHPPKIEERTYAIPREKMLGNSKKVFFSISITILYLQLFKFIAETLANFMKRYGVEKMSLPLGFTFSFPCEQQGLNQSVLVRWTKGFHIEDAVGADVAYLLQNAIDKLVRD